MDFSTGRRAAEAVRRLPRGPDTAGKGGEALAPSVVRPGRGLPVHWWADGVAQQIGAGRQSGGWDGDGCRGRSAAPSTAPKGLFGVARTVKGAVTLMILPQVHLRKPCYDFYFL